MTVLRISAESVTVTYAVSSALQVSSTNTTVFYATTSSLQVSSTNTTVLYSEDSDLRLYQFVVQVAYLEESATPASNTITLTQASSAVYVPVQPTTSTLTVTQSTSAYIVKLVSDTLSLTQDAVGSILDRIGSTLVFIQDVSVALVLNKSTSNVLPLSQLASYTNSYGVSASNTLSLSQAISKEVPVSATNSVTFIHAGVAARAAESVLTLVDSVSGAVVYLTGIADQSITLTDTVGLDKVIALSASNTLSWSLAADPDRISDHSATNTLALTQTIFYTDHDYTLLQARGEVSLALPTPIFSDTENIVSDFVVKRAMDGTRRTYTQTQNWRILKYTFRMSRLKALALEDFVREYSADQLILTNWKGERWSTYLITNPVDFVQTGRHFVDVDLTFEGVRLNA